MSALKLSELEIVPVKICHYWKLSELENVPEKICQNWKLSELEIVPVKKSALEVVRIGHCKNWLSFWCSKHHNSCLDSSMFLS